MKTKIYALSLFFLIQSCSSNKKEVTSLEGKIEREQIAVTTKIPGKIHQILVEDGQIVQKGDTLIVIELPEVEAKSIQAQGALEAAQAQYDMAVKGATSGQLKQLQAKVDGLKEQYDFAKKSLDRMGNLLKDSLISQQNYDAIYAKYHGAKNQLLAAQAEYAEVSNGARMEQQKMALGQKERALGAVSEVNVAAQERFILAPQAMSIETINLKVGELALAGYSLVSGYLIDDTYFRLTVPEGQIKDFEKGSIKTLNLPYLNNKEIKATVVTVKALTSYADINTAYPDFEQHESLFEVRLKPVNKDESRSLLTKATFVIKLK